MGNSRFQTILLLTLLLILLSFIGRCVWQRYQQPSGTSGLNVFSSSLSEAQRKHTFEQAVYFSEDGEEPLAFDAEGLRINLPGLDSLLQIQEGKAYFRIHKRKATERVRLQLPGTLPFRAVYPDSSYALGKGVIWVAVKSPSSESK